MSEINKIYNHIPPDMEMCMWFQGFAEIQIQKFKVKN